MSHLTEADENLQAAKTSIREALLAVNKIVVLECHGFDDFNPVFTEKLRRAHSSIITTIDLLQNK